MQTATLTKNLDRWDLISDRVYGVADLAWAIAQANPELADNLILPAGTVLNIPELATLRRPLTAANPAREDDGEFLPLPADDTPTPIDPGGGGGGGDYVPLSAVGVTVAPLFNNLVPVGNLPPYPTLASLNGLSAEVINAALALKADASAVSAALALKVDASTYSAAIALKADITALTAGLALKVDTSTYTAAIALKADITALTAGLALKVDTSTYSAGLALKADITALTAGLALKVDTSTYSAGLALKLDTSARNASNGVAGLTSGFLSIAQFPLANFFPFTGGASFTGTPSPAIPLVSTSLVQASLDASGQPRIWIVNAAASAGNRLKSITIASNGNVQIRHHADDGTDGNVLEHTASGNVLTNGTVRPGSGSSAFTGASFVPGSTYFRTDLLGDSGTGCSTYSDGSVWRRVSDGTLTTEPDLKRKIITGTTPAIQNSTVNVAHGLTGSKILGWSIKITQSTNAGILQHFTGIAGYDIDCYHDPTNFTVSTTAANSASVLSKPFTILVTYTS